MGVNRVMEIIGTPLIGIMVLNRNGLSWLGPLYESINSQDYPRFRIYLVDNASTKLKERLNG